MNSIFNCLDRQSSIAQAEHSEQAKIDGKEAIIELPSEQSWLVAQPRIQSNRKGPRAAIKLHTWTQFVELADVISIEADGNYVIFQLNSRCYILRESISEMESKLAPFGFIRINRSVLVNSAAVEGIKPSRSGEYLLRLIGGKQHSVTRKYRSNLGSLAALWIGICIRDVTET